MFKPVEREYDCLNSRDIKWLSLAKTHLLTLTLVDKSELVAFWQKFWADKVQLRCKLSFTCMTSLKHLCVICESYLGFQAWNNCVSG